MRRHRRAGPPVNAGPERDRSQGELFGDLARVMGVLVRQEVGLVTTAMTHMATRMVRNVAVVAVGGLVAYAGVLAILTASSSPSPRLVWRGGWLPW